VTREPRPVIRVLLEHSWACSPPAWPRCLLEKDRTLGNELAAGLDANKAF